MCIGTGSFYGSRMFWIIAGNGTAPDIWASPTRSHCSLQKEHSRVAIGKSRPVLSVLVQWLRMTSLTLQTTWQKMADTKHWIEWMQTGNCFCFRYRKKYFHFTNFYIDLINLVSAHSDELWHRSMVIQKAYIFLPTKPAHMFSIQFSFVNLCSTYFAITNLFLAPGICSLSY